MLQPTADADGEGLFGVTIAVVTQQLLHGICRQGRSDRNNSFLKQFYYPFAEPIAYRIKAYFPNTGYY